MKATENFIPGNTKQTENKNELSFEINSLQWLYENNSDYFNRPISNNNFEIIWMVKGKGVHYVDMQSRCIENNHIFFIKPGQVQQFHLTDKPEGYFLSFSESFLSIENQESNSTYHTSLFNMFASSRDISIDTDALPDMKNIVEKMIIEFNSTNLFRTEILRRYFKILLIYITRQVEENIEFTSPSRNMEIVQQFMGSLEKNYKKQKMVSDYASMLSVTPNYLNEIIKKTTGFSAGHHIRQRIALEAKRQATYSGQCMKEIAYFLGFYDMAHFSKFFKNTTGMNFSDFKKEKRLLASSVSLVN
ncbi:MAG: helix-turn-helix domain-containing protein [Ferruginibacter sp.]